MMMTKVDEAERILKSSEDTVCFLEQIAAEQSNQLLAKDVAARGFQEQITELEREVANRL